jgi:hypothetical protein
VRAAIDELDETLFRRGKKHVEGLDVGIEAEFLVFGKNPFRIVFVVGRADVVGMRGQTLHIGAKICRARCGAEFFFPLALGAGGFCGITRERRFLRNALVATWREGKNGEKGRRKNRAAHYVGSKFASIFCLKAAGIGNRGQSMR